MLKKISFVVLVINLFLVTSFYADITRVNKAVLPTNFMEIMNNPTKILIKYIPTSKIIDGKIYNYYSHEIEAFYGSSDRFALVKSEDSYNFEYFKSDSTNINGSSLSYHNINSATIYKFPYEKQGVSVQRFGLGGYDVETDTYISNSHEVKISGHEGRKEFFAIFSDEKIGDTGLKPFFEIRTVGTSTFNFYENDKLITDSFFQVGVTPPQIKTEGLNLITEMVKIAVIILVSLMGLLIVLRACLKALRVLLRI